jgi:hypothetical protein
MPTDIRAVSPRLNTGAWRNGPSFGMTDFILILISTVTALLVAIGLAILLPPRNDASGMWAQLAQPGNYSGMALEASVMVPMS